MPCYMIQAGDIRGPVKLGHGDPIKRRMGLQVGNHLELRIIRVFRGGAKEERQLHAQFSELEIRGEWYSFSRAMLGNVGLVEIPFSEWQSPPRLNIINPVTGKVGREWTTQERAAVSERMRAISADPERRALRLERLRATNARKFALGIIKTCASSKSAIIPDLAA